MKKILSLIALVVVAFQSNAQVVFTSSFENWTGTNPDGWKGSKTNLQADSIIEVTSGTMYGLKAVQLNNPTTSHKRFSTQPVAVTAGQNFEVKFWAKGQGDIRVGLFDSSNVVTTSGYHYAAYIAVNTTSWTEYTQNITADTTWNTAQFILSIRNTVGANGHLKVDSVAISIATPAGPSSIYDIQYTTLPSGDSPLATQSVNTGGIVSAVYASGYFIQDGTGPWNGVHVYDPTNTPAIGDSVTLTATVEEYFNMTQLGSVSNFAIFSSGNTPYAAAQIATSDVNTEPYEGVLVETSNATCVNANAGFGMWTINDGSADCKVHDLIFSYTPTAGNVYLVRGPSYYSFGEFRILPRDANDVIVEGFASVDELSSEILGVFPNPASEILTISGNFVGATLSMFDLSGRLVLCQSLTSENQQISVEMLNQGSYIVLVQSNQVVASTKFQKI